MGCVRARAAESCAQFLSFLSICGFGSPGAPAWKVRILSDFFPLLVTSQHPSYSGIVPCQDQGLFLDHSADHTQQQQPALTAPAVPRHRKAGRNNFPSQGNVSSAVALFRCCSSREKQLRYSSKVRKVSLEFNASEGENSSSWKIDVAVKSSLLPSSNKEFFRHVMRCKVSVLKLFCTHYACKDVFNDKLACFRKEYTSSPC